MSIYPQAATNGRQYLTSSPTVPSPSSTTYLLKTESTATTHKLFNTTSTLLRTITISGMQIVIDAAQDDNHLFQEFNGARDVEAMTLVADEVIINSPWALPGTNITIYARALTFGTSGKIITTPVQWTTAAAPSDGTKNGADGQKGQAAGTVTLSVKQLNTGSGNAVRFDLTGADGQEPGAGIPGTEGHTAEVWDFSTYYARPDSTEGGQDTSKDDPRSSASMSDLVNQSEINKLKKTYTSHNIVYAEIDNNSFGGADARNLGGYGRDVPDNNLPGDGQSPQWVAGMPGVGGNGGNLHTTILPNSGSYKLDHGLTAQPKTTAGGKAGTPQHWAKLYIYDQDAIPHNYIWYDKKSGTRITGHGTTHAGPDILGQIQHNTGTTGKVSKITGLANQWLHPLLLQTVCHYVDDVFLSGDRELTATILATYLTALDQAAPTNLAWQLPFDNSRSRLATLQHRLDSNLDYFQNPAGWTPLLSLQANMTLYEDEVEDALRVLFLAYWMDHQAKNTQEAVNAIDNAIDKLDDVRTTALKRLSTANNTTIPNLESSINNIQLQLPAIQKELENVYNTLTAQAVGDVQAEHTIKFLLKTASAICMVIPAGQPVLGLVGGGVDVLSNIDFKADPPDFKTTGKALNDIFKDYSKKLAKGKNVKDTAKDLETTAKTTVKDAAGKAPDPAKAKSKAATLNTMSKQIGPALNELCSGLAALRAPESEINARLAELETQSVEYQGLVTKIRQLNEDKKRAAHLLTSALQQVADAESIITHSLLATDALYAQRAQTLDLLDHEALLYTRSMGQAAMRQLIQYQYYLLKSYEYQVLEPYDGVDYGMADLFAKCDTLLSQSTDGQLTVQQFQTLTPIFENTLVGITRDLVSKFQTGSFGVRSTRLTDTFKLAKAADQPAATATTGGESIFNVFNFMDAGIILPSMQAGRVADIQITCLKTRSQPDVNNQLTIRFTHSDDGTLRGNGQLFAFRTMPAENDPSLGVANKSWGATVTFDASGTPTISNCPGVSTINQIQPSPDSALLLEHLLNDPQISGQGQELLNYKPPAWANIVITTESTGPTIDVTEVTFTYVLEYADVPDSESTLEVRGPVGQHPLIFCRATNPRAHSDLNGQTDGAALLLRMYPLATEVEVMPYGYLGSQMFAEWQDKDGNTVSTDLGLTLGLDTDPNHSRGDRILQCVYGPASYREPLAPVNVEKWARALGDSLKDASGAVVKSKNWVPGFTVRYAISFVDAQGQETKLGPWSRWYQSADHQCAIVQDIPVDPTHTAVKRRLYRQFHPSAAPSMIFEIPDNDQWEVYTDLNP